MQQNKLHIVSFDVPYPANYGGAIDIFYKIKALKDAGLDIYLHCFQYGRAESEELNALCKEVWYYPRNTGIAGISLKLPYIVQSRSNKLLLKRLNEIDAPILFEGVHTTYYLSHPTLANRKKAIRTHNIEADYYKLLTSKEKNLLKKLYYTIESKLLKRYEQKLNNADAFFALSMEDEKHFANLYTNSKHQFVGPFHPNEKVVSKTGKGDFCLYHGNLSHPENIEAVMFLLNNVFPVIQTPFVIAGRNPANEIIEECKKLKHCQLLPNPTENEMGALISNAQIHILPTFQQSGMKLKLLYALYNGRHVLANRQMLYGTGLDGLCHIANTPQDFITEIENLIQSDFTETEIAKREQTLQQDYNNAGNAQKIITWMQQ